MSQAEGMPNRGDRSEPALILLQAAAARAEIGPFARRDRASPQLAASRYGAAAGLGRTTDRPQALGRGTLRASGGARVEGLRA